MIVENANAKNAKQIRVLETILQEVGNNYSSANMGVNRSLYLLLNLEKRLSAELKGVFTKAELSALLDANNGVLIAEPFWGSQRMMVFSLEDSEEFEGLGAKWEISINKLCSKIKALSPAVFLFLHEEIYRFWNEVPAYGSPSPSIEDFLKKYCDEPG